MENSISYFAGGKRFKFTTPIMFGDLTNEQIAIKVYLDVSFDRNTRLLNKEIPNSLTDEEKSHMNDDDIFEWLCINHIEFVDYISKKKFTMHHMSDFQWNFRVDPLE